MNLSIFVLLISLSVATVTSWKIFPLPENSKEATPKPSVSAPVASTSSLTPSRFPAPAPLSITAFKNPVGVAAPSKDLLPPKGSLEISTPAKPSLISTSRIEPPPRDLLPPKEKVVPSAIIPKLPIIPYTTTTTNKPLVVTTKKVPTPLKPNDLLTPKIFFTNSVSKSPPTRTLLSDDDDNIDFNGTPPLLTPNDSNIINETVSITQISSNASSGNITHVDRGIKIKEDVPDQTQATTTTLELTSTSSTTITSTLSTMTILSTTTSTASPSSTQSILSSKSEDESTSVEIITSPPILSSSTTEETLLKRVVSFRIKDPESSSSEPATTTTVAFTSPPQSVTSSGSGISVATAASIAEQLPLNVRVPENTEKPLSETISTILVPTSTAATVSSTQSKIIATVVSNVLLPEVNPPSIELLPPKVPIVPPKTSFFSFPPIHIELLPPKEE